MIRAHADALTVSMNPCGVRKGLLTYPVEIELPRILKLWNMPRMVRQSLDDQLLCWAAHGLVNFPIWEKIGPICLLVA